jgi:serine/threonine protein kinase
MPIPLNDFWKLAIDCRLLSADDCQRLDSAFGRVPGAQQGNAATLAEWLVASGVLSRYQSSVLLAGKARPFLFGDYKVFDRHESGRLKGIYRAVHLPTGHAVALYFLSSGLQKEPQQVAAVMRQAQIMAGVRDDRLSRVFEFVERKTSKFVVIEDLAGITLADYLLSQPLAPADACRLVRDLALAAAALHEHGLAHGDIRPQNIWLTAEGGVKLLGFPLGRDPAQSAAYRIGEGPPSSRLSAQADFLAPELAFGRRAPDARADIYSLGCLMYALLIGRPPFAEGDVADKLARHASEPAVPLDQFGMPPALSQLVAHMMAKNPPVRLDSAAEVAAQLGPFASPDPTAGRPASPTLAAFDRLIAERQPPIAAPGSAAAAPTTSSNSAPGNQTPSKPASGKQPPSDAPAEKTRRSMPPAAAPAEEFADDSGSVAVADHPAMAAQRLSPVDDLRPVRPRGVRTKSKARKMNPMVLAGGALAMFALAGVVAGLATRPSPDDRPQVATNTNVGTEIPPKPEKPKKHRRTEKPETTDNPDDRDTGYEDDSPAVSDTPAKPKGPKTRQPEKAAFREVDDDGSSLWTSPTDGSPVSLRYMPSGAQAFIITRLSAALGNPEGSRMIDGMGPAGQFAKDQIQAVTGFEPSRIEQLIAGFYVNEAGALSTAYLVRLNEAVDEEVLLGAWKNPTAAEHGGKKYFKSAENAYYVLPEEKGRVFAIMPVTEAEDVLDSERPQLTPAMDKLLAETDSQRHFTILAAPFALFRAGKSIFVGELSRLQEPLNRFLGADVPAAMFSVHVGSDLFLELRVNGDAADEPVQMAAKYKQQLEKVPEEIETYTASFNSQYGKLVLVRFPQMIRTLFDFTRVGEDHRQAILRAYLPANAGHNLVMGTELSLFDQPGGASSVVAKTPAPAKASGPAEALKQKISLSFPRDTLEKSMELLGKEIDTEVIILGSDLQLEGITKNQSFGLDERDKPAEEILRTVLNKANPDGKLVYVIKPKDGGKDVIFITTRAAVEKRGDKLPPELVQNPAKGK